MQVVDSSSDFDLQAGGRRFESCTAHHSLMVRPGHMGNRMYRLPPAYCSPTALLSTTRRRTTLATRTRSAASQAAESTLALSPMWRPHGGHRKTYCGPAPNSFSALARWSRGMTLAFRSRSLVSPNTYRLRALSLPTHLVSGFELPLANYNRTKPAGAPVRSITDSPSLSHHGNTIETA